MRCRVGLSKHNNSFISDLMAFKIGKQYSHVFMLFDVMDKQIVLHATRKGVNAVSFEKFQEENTILKLIDITDEQKIKKAFSYCIDMLGTPYGYLDILAIAFGLKYKDNEKTLICSEYVARALDLSDDDSITPNEVEERL